MPNAAPDRHVEMSAWHRVEIDNKTGQAVESAEVPYGEEFKKETQKETLQATPQAGGSFSGSGDSGGSGAQSPGTLFIVNQGLEDTNQENVKPGNSRQAAKDVVKRQAGRPLTWLLAIFIAILIFGLTQM
jgi:hypothetical protein